MGVPALFRWLTQKYPKITSPAVEELPKEINGHTIPVDYSLPNPNTFETQNLYLDMNGIIHPCCHPEDKPAPKNEDEMFREIFIYIDRILSIVRPRSLLYMAIDGVAPRAKMNQQRSRRFRAALDAQEKIQSEEKLKQEWESEHGPLPEKEKSEYFDSNCITPGTPFMARLAIALKYYIAERLNSNIAWRGLKVVLSDATVPGEGEHKIMDYIRRQRFCEGYDPNTMHVLYGLDADLIMLALATHEPNFKILREDVFFKDGANRACFICGQAGHDAAQCTGKPKLKSGDFDEKSDNHFIKPYVFLHIEILREYLQIQLKVQDLPFYFDFERAIDDFVFLCFFVGNDFLPHLPSLEIREGAIDKLVEIWKRNLIKSGGFITCDGEIDLPRACDLLSDVGKLEDEIFKKRKLDEQRRIENQKRRKEYEEANEIARKEMREAKSAPAIVEAMGTLPMFPVKGMSKEEIVQSNREAMIGRELGVSYGGGKNYDANKNAALLLKAKLLASNKGIVEVNETLIEKSPIKSDVIIGKKRKEPEEPQQPELNSPKTVAIDHTEINTIDLSAIIQQEFVIEDLPSDDIDPIDDVPFDEPIPVIETVAIPEEIPDDVRFWEAGWKKRYYKNKFQVDENDSAFRREICTKYVEGLCWVLKYYYQGCQSWNWYFPYHYSPFASDFDFIGELKITFSLGKPFKPFEQLMGVFPAASRSHIPAAFQPLMINADSEIIDFYPEKFPIDLNGKKYAWQGVALLPFIDESRLLEIMQKSYHLLTEEEIHRNTIGNDLLWVGQFHPTFDKLCILYTARDNAPMRLIPQLTNGMSGKVMKDPEIVIPGCSFMSPLVHLGYPDIVENQSISCVYFMPEYEPDYIFEARLNPNAKVPRRILNTDDYYHVKVGNDRNQRPGQGRMNIESVGRFVGHNVRNGSQFYNQRNNEESPRQSNYQSNQSYNNQSNQSGGYKTQSSLNYQSNYQSNHQNNAQSSYQSGYQTNYQASYNRPSNQQNLNQGTNQYNQNKQPYNQYNQASYNQSNQYNSNQYQDYNQPRPNASFYQPSGSLNYPRPTSSVQPPRPNLAWSRNVNSQK